MRVVCGLRTAALQLRLRMRLRMRCISLDFSRNARDVPERMRGRMRARTRAQTQTEWNAPKTVKNPALVY
jgi:hypothetical protein